MKGPIAAIALAVLFAALPTVDAAATPDARTLAASNLCDGTHWDPVPSAA